MKKTARLVIAIFLLIAVAITVPLLDRVRIRGFCSTLHAGDPVSSAQQRADFT